MHTIDLLDRITATGGHHLIALADGHRVTVHGQADAEEFDEVYLHPGLDVDWDHPEDTVELFLSGDPELAKGRLFLEVPVSDVAVLIDEHGGASDA